MSKWVSYFCEHLLYEDNIYSIYVIFTEISHIYIIYILCVNTAEFLSDRIIYSVWRQQNFFSDRIVHCVKTAELFFWQNRLIFGWLCGKISRNFCHRINCRYSASPQPVVNYRKLHPPWSGSGFCRKISRKFCHRINWIGGDSVTNFPGNFATESKKKFEKTVWAEVRTFFCCSASQPASHGPGHHFGGRERGRL